MRPSFTRCKATYLNFKTVYSDSLPPTAARDRDRPASFKLKTYTTYSLNKELILSTIAKLANGDI